MNKKNNRDLHAEDNLDLAYKEKQRERLAKHIVGAQDNSGNTISRIFTRSDEYIVYEISGVSESESFRVLIDTSVESDPKALISKFEEIKEELADFRSILHKGVHDKSIKHRAAHAVSTAIRGDVNKAKQIFSAIHQQVTKEYQDILLGRIIYLSGAFSLLAILIATSIVFYAFREHEFSRQVPVLRELIYAAAFAGCGGLLSVCINLRLMQFEGQLKRYSYYLYGLLRIALAALSGIFAYVLVVSGVLLSFLLGSEKPLLSIMAICIVAGFSETFIPNALKKIETQNGQA